MADSIVCVERLGKRYRLRHEGGGGPRYRTLRDALAAAPARWWRAAGRTPGAAREDFWALRDVSFGVARGEVVGIIGRNGAGKSTLLKILSRITEPTEGRVTLDGRVSSLLEVGTGFHPELTGRENVYLNGAILGMSRAEIARKFDEIVAFAGVERFLDTAVKHYSSGMYVRLAFAVAAHLEPDVLVVDEVLAVGDAEFQRRSLGKMRDVSQGGRTVLFVSHNMAAVSSLTSRAIVLDRGCLVFDGATAEAVRRYSVLTSAVGHERGSLGHGAHTAIRRVRLLSEQAEDTGFYVPGSSIHLEIQVETDGTASLSLEAFLLDAARQRLALASLHHFEGITLPAAAGCYRVALALSPLWLASGRFTFDVTTSVVNSNWDHYVEDAVAFDVVASNPRGRPWDHKQSLGYGALALPCVTPPRLVRESPAS